MSEEWSPYREGEKNLPDYPYIYNMDILREFFSHPQILENMLYELAPEAFCYGFCWEADRIDRSTSILFSYLAVKDESVTTWLKLQTGLNPLDKSKLYVKLTCPKEIWELQHV